MNGEENGQRWWVDEDPWERAVRFTCTGKPGADHPSREIVVVGYNSVTGELSDVGNGQGSARAVRRSGGMQGGHGHADWEPQPCPTCGHAPRLTHARMRALVAGILTQDQSSSDRITFPGWALVD